MQDLRAQPTTSNAAPANRDQFQRVYSDGVARSVEEQNFGSYGEETNLGVAFISKPLRRLNEADDAVDATGGQT
jgi:hypothetical protein